MKFEIKHRWTGDVLFEAEIEADENTPFSVRLGLAVRAAVRFGASLDEANLNRASLNGASLYKASLYKANLNGASLYNANLDWANLDGASLYNANLYKASLYKADLNGASLDGASLYNANLDGANLYRANLYKANLNGVQWGEGALWNGERIKSAPLQISCLRWPVTILDQHMQIGCEFHALSDWAAFEDRRILEMDGRAALDFWRAHGTALLALAASDGRGCADSGEAAA